VSDGDEATKKERVSFKRAIRGATVLPRNSQPVKLVEAREEQAEPQSR